MSCLLYPNGDGTASGRFPGNPFVDAVAKLEDAECILLRFVDVLTNRKISEVKLTARLNARGKTEYVADDSEFYIYLTQKGKAKMGVARRVGGPEGAASDLAAAFGL